jgi:hypothetical protein
MRSTQLAKSLDFAAGATSSVVQVLRLGGDRAFAVEEFLDRVLAAGNEDFGRSG